MQIHVFTSSPLIYQAPKRQRMSKAHLSIRLRYLCQFVSSFHIHRKLHRIAVALCARKQVALRNKMFGRVATEVENEIRGQITWWSLGLFKGWCIQCAWAPCACPTKSQDSVCKLGSNIVSELLERTYRGCCALRFAGSSTPPAQLPDLLCQPCRVLSSQQLHAPF